MYSAFDVPGPISDLTWTTVAFSTGNGVLASALADRRPADGEKLRRLVQSHQVAAGDQVTTDDADDDDEKTNNYQHRSVSIISIQKRTTSGSRCNPDERTNSALASSCDIGSWYGRCVVSPSYKSASAMMRAAT